MSFAQIELKVIQAVDKAGSLKNTSSTEVLDGLKICLGALAEANEAKSLEDVKGMVGCVVLTLIVFCTLKDIDLTSCTKYAFDKQVADAAA